MILLNDSEKKKKKKNRNPPPTNAANSAIRGEHLEMVNVRIYNIYIARFT